MERIEIPQGGIFLFQYTMKTIRARTQDRAMPPAGGEPPHPPRVDKSGGGGDDGGMEARIAKLEAAVEHIEKDIRDIKQDVREMRSDMRSDFRLQFGALITAALGLAGLMAHGFHWL